MEVGVRGLRENLAEWLDRAAAGEEILVTERGNPKVLITAARGEALLDGLIRDGIATAPKRRERSSRRPIPVEGNPVSDEIISQRHASRT